MLARFATADSARDQSAKFAERGVADESVRELDRTIHRGEAALERLIAAKEVKLTHAVICSGLDGPRRALP